MATKSPFITTAIPAPTPPTGDAASFGARMKANASARIATSDRLAAERSRDCATPMSTTRSGMGKGTSTSSTTDSPDSTPTPKGFAPSAR